MLRQFYGLLANFVTFAHTRTWQYQINIKLADFLICIFYLDMNNNTFTSKFITLNNIKLTSVAEMQYKK